MGSRNSNVVTLTLGTPAATPTFAPAAGTYAGTQSVVISCTTPAAVIHYTVDGSTPTLASPVYATPISVPASVTIKAMAVATGFTESAIASAAYVITPVVVVPVTFVLQAASNSHDPLGAGGAGNGWAISDPVNWAPIIHGVGANVTALPIVYAGAQIGGWWYDSFGSGTMQLFLQGTHAKNFLSSVQWTDRLGAVETFLQANSTLDTSSWPGFTLWSWPAVLANPFTNGNNYSVTVTP